MRSEMGAPSDPIREWREQYARCCLSLDFEPVTGSPFHATVKPIFEDPRAVRTALSPGMVFRDEELVRDGDDSFGFLISRSRQLDATHQGCELRLGLGDATMMQASAPSSVGSRQSFGFFEVMLPPAEWVARDARPSEALMRLVWSRSDSLQLLRGYLRSLERVQSIPPGDVSEIVRRHLIDLVVLAATRHRSIGESSASAVVAARLHAAHDEIAACFQDPELSLATVAARLRISRRYLQRLLEGSGTSFTARVNELRLQRAFELLSVPGAVRIADVALAAGFSDISHFNRLFRARFGDTPGSVRAQAAGPPRAYSAAICPAWGLRSSL